MPNAASLESEYPVVMNSIAGRLTASMDALQIMKDAPEDTTNWLRIDLVALQMRKVCELVLLGSALAHLQEGHSELDPRKWRPKDAFRQLSKLSEQPLPVPLRSKITAQSGIQQLIPASKPLPFEVLSAIYGHCGDLLHVPSAEKVLKETVPPFHWEKFHGWVSGFLQLLHCHLILLPSIHRVILCTWSGVPNEPPRIALWEGDGPAILVTDDLPPFGLLAA